MAVLDRLKKLASQNPEKLSEGLGKVTEAIDKRTGGKYRDQLEKVTSTVESKLPTGGPKLDVTDEPVVDLVEEPQTPTTSDEVPTTIEPEDDTPSS